MLILSVIEQLKLLKPDHNEGAGRSTSPTPQEKLKSLLIADERFRLIVYDKLDKEILPNDSEIRWIVRILCAPFEKSILDGKGYPTSNEQWILAKTIVQTFPKLKETKVNDLEPEEVS
ncbi:uncharacterized protein LOC129728303 [Wyeomyia smithii]|uniref:uncharacterized protein LOC129728303 n=1 Tax=Wyeomyia smithii TaxID=174621 RepID=UPI002467DC87|nr:uncharacterized protein LOC129728303 [Wyeomyia smithii]